MTRDEVEKESEGGDALSRPRSRLQRRSRGAAASLLTCWLVLACVCVCVCVRVCVRAGAWTGVSGGKVASGRLPAPVSNESGPHHHDGLCRLLTLLSFPSAPTLLPSLDQSSMRGGEGASQSRGPRKSAGADVLCRRILARSWGRGGDGGLFHTPAVKGRKLGPNYDTTTSRVLMASWAGMTGQATRDCRRATGPIRACVLVSRW